MAIVLCRQLCSVFSYTPPVTQCCKQRTLQEAALQSIQLLQKIRAGDKHNSQCSHRLAIMNQHLALSAKELEHKEGQRQVHDACIVHIAVGKKAHLKTKQRRTVNKSNP